MLCDCGERIAEHSPAPGVGCRRSDCLCLSTPGDIMEAEQAGLLGGVQVLHVLSDRDIDKIKRDAYIEGVMNERHRWTWGEAPARTGE